jgi:hypothetical protein
LARQPPEVIEETFRRLESGEMITRRTLTLRVDKTIEGPTTVVIPRDVPAERSPPRVVYRNPLSSLPPPSIPSLPPLRPSLPPPSEPPSMPKSESAEWSRANALLDALVEFPLPDTLVLAEAANQRKDVDYIREICIKLGKLASKLSADTASTETPPEGGRWR